MSAYPGNPQRDQLHPFLNNVVEIRWRARQHIEEGAAPAGRAADRQAVLRLLNAALATELVCVQRYRCYSAMDRLSDAVKNEFAKRAEEEQGHADQIVARIVELGGQPNPAPPSAPAQADGAYAEEEILSDMFAEDLIAERIAIDTYREIIRFVAEHDPTTRQLFESILAVEREHAQGLASIRERIRRRDGAAASINHSSPPN
jgi:bacterioferritin